MFNKDLFLSLCEKYKVELSETDTKPMLKEKERIHVIADEDVKRLFTPYQTFFEYSDNKIKTNIDLPEFSLQEDYFIAC